MTCPDCSTAVSTVYICDSCSHNACDYCNTMYTCDECGLTVCEDCARSFSPDGYCQICSEEIEVTRQSEIDELDFD